MVSTRYKGAGDISSVPGVCVRVGKPPRRPSMTGFRRCSPKPSCWITPENRSFLMKTIRGCWKKSPVGCLRRSPAFMEEARSVCSPNCQRPTCGYGELWKTARRLRWGISGRFHRHRRRRCGGMEETGAGSRARLTISKIKEEAEDTSPALPLFRYCPDRRSTKREPCC